MRRIILLALLLLVTVVAAVVVKTTGHAGTGRGDSAATPRWEYLAVAGPSTTNFSPTGNPTMRKEDVPFAREGFVLEQHLDKLGAKRMGVGFSCRDALGSGLLFQASEIVDGP